MNYVCKLYKLYDLCKLYELNKLSELSEADLGLLQHPRWSAL